MRILALFGVLIKTQTWESKSALRIKYRYATNLQININADSESIHQLSGVILDWL